MMDPVTTRTARLLSKLSRASPKTIHNHQQHRRFQTRAASHIESLFAQSAKPARTATATAPAAGPRRTSNDAILELERESNSEQESTINAVLRETQRRAAKAHVSKEERIAKARQYSGMEKLLARQWQAGDLYTPHDLTPREISQFRTPAKPKKDIFDALGLNPIDAYKNPVLLAEFMTSGGLIKHPSQTGLRPVNQRKVAKAIRRAIGMGLMPSCHVHPEMLRRFGPDRNTLKYRWR